MSDDMPPPRLLPGFSFMDKPFMTGSAYLPFCP